jgi:hypothetical protein
MSFVVVCTECDDEIIQTDNATVITQQLLDNHDDTCPEQQDDDEDED